MRRWISISILFSMLAFAGNVSAGEEHYLLMFGSQRVPANPNYSHTFASFVMVKWEGDEPCPKSGQIYCDTISWLPANLKIRTGALRPEPGANFDLHSTLDVAYSTCQRVSLWGPYRVEPCLYHRALARKHELERGTIRYKANDFGYRSDRVANCIHAVSTIVEGPKLRVASPGWGESASYFVLKEMEPSILSQNPEVWVSSALGLDEYPIIYRDFTNPRSNAIFGPAYRLFGGERNLRATYGPPVR